MSKTYKILQLEKLGKKLDEFIISVTEKSGRLLIHSCEYGPTSHLNCKLKLRELKNEKK